MNTQDLQLAFDKYFAPWVQDLGLIVQPWQAADVGRVSLCLPQNERLSRVGGMLCGQAMMAAADTAVVLTLMAHFGAFRPCTTVQLSSAFLKPLSNDDAIVKAQVVRAGKSTAFVDVDISAASSGACVFRATAVYALL
jgi:acyl-coenzyme A thioesterase PaaI-like protein